MQNSLKITVRHTGPVLQGDVHRYLKVSHTVMPSNITVQQDSSDLGTEIKRGL